LQALALRTRAFAVAVLYGGVAWHGVALASRDNR
jgi:hypothetical protein